MKEIIHSCARLSYRPRLIMSRSSSGFNEDMTGVEEIAVLPRCTVRWVVLLRALLRIGERSWGFVVCVRRGFFRELAFVPVPCISRKETCG